MTRAYSIAEARNQLPGIVHEVETGSAVEITRRGKPVAVLLSKAEYERLTGKKRTFWDAYQEWRTTVDVEGMDEAVDELLLRRDRSPGREIRL